MKKLLFLLLQTFLCLGSAKDAGPSSLGRGYGTGNSAVSAQSSLSGDQKARLADVIYLTGVGPMIYQDFIKFWDGQKAGDFLQSVVHLAQQYPAGGDRDQYWTEIFTYLLQREPQLYEALKRFPRVSGFINANAEYFDEVVKTAKENIAELDKIANDIFSKKSIDEIKESDVLPIIEFIIQNNINVRNPILIENYKKPLFNIIFEKTCNKAFIDSTTGKDFFKRIFELGDFSSKTKSDEKAKRGMARYMDFDMFKMFVDHGFLPTKKDLYLIIQSASGTFGGVDRADSIENYEKLEYLATRGFKYPLDFANIEFVTNGRIDKLSHFNDFIDKLLSIGATNPENLLANIYMRHKPDLFMAAKKYLDEKEIKHTIDNGDYEKAEESVQELINRNYLKIGNQWVKKGIEDIVLELFGQKKQPTYPNRGIIFNR